MLNEVKISQAIIEGYYQKLINNLNLDVAICGAGPSGLVCAALLAKEGKKVAVFERKLSIGGGMWGGGMMFNEIVVQKKAKKLLDEFGIRSRNYQEDYFLVDAVESVCALGYKALQNGAVIFNGISVEDVVIRENCVSGLVINWSAVESAGLHVDPLALHAKYVVDATGHPMEVVKIIERKSGLKLALPENKVQGEKSMWAELAESKVEDYTRQICPGFFVAGMCANSVFGAPRMGPIFGGMFLSGKKAAQLILEQLKD